MALKLANNAVSQLAANVAVGATTLAVTPGDGAKFPTLGAGDWFPLTVVKSSGALEIMRCTARTTDTLTVSRAQEGTAALAFSAGDRVELRWTSAAYLDVSSRADTAQASANAAQATANAALPKAGGAMAGSLQGKVSGSNASYSFGANTTSGLYATMWDRRGGPFYTYANDTSNAYAPSVTMEYAHNNAWNGVYSMGVLNSGVASAGSLVLHHINASGTENQAWQFSGTTGDFTSPGNVSAYSDESLKEDWAELPDDIIEQMAEVLSGTFTRKDTGARQVGVGAQSLRNVLPEAVIDGEKLSVAYGNAALALCVKLSQRLIALTKRIAVLEAGK
jgi:hypothetical protein